jgi:hypothetical protein
LVLAQLKLEEKGINHEGIDLAAMIVSSHQELVEL